MHTLGSTLLALALAAALAAGCGSGDSAPEPAGADAGTHAEASGPKTEKTRRSETPLPAFSGWTLDDERIEVSSLLGKRLVLYFFNPEISDSGVVTQATTRIAKLRDEHNFQVLGVAVGSSRPKAKAFAKEHGIDFPVIDDSAARISGRLGLRQPLAMIGVDGDGYVVWGMLQFNTEGDQAVDQIETQLRTALRLPEEEDLVPGERPLAPTFTALSLGEDERFDLADTRGEPLLLIFFLHTCPHCHEALEFLEEAIADLPEDKRPKLVGLEITGRTAAVRSAMRELDLDFFPVLFDDQGGVQAAYGAFAGVPDLLLIDREGRIAHRVQGWRAEIDGPVLKMQLAKLVGAPVPMLLRSKGFSGNEVCGTCHESQHQTWRLTNHARAFDTLVKHGSDSDPECVGCHVVGFGQAGGFDLAQKPTDREDVGCESCHGRGGPHLSPGFVEAGNYEKACLTCHDTKHSLGFEYGSFLPKVSHAANLHILALPAEERQRILAERGALRTDLLPTTAAHVGSEACQSCHAAEYETWAAGPHAGAVATLEAKGQAGDAACLRCHTTGFGREGGFPTEAAVADHPDLARVGCESCHGPGGDHVAEGATRLGSIVSLGDKCDSCVILQICGGCHDDANDPGFEFEVQDKIDRIRHGTIEAGTGKPLEGKSARAPDPARDEAAWIAHAFAERARRAPEAGWTPH